VIPSSLKRLFTPDASTQQAHQAYVQIVAQARKPVFYADWQVPDTLDGRFDIILLHLFLVVSRCEAEGSHTQRFIRHLSEVFFADMDRSLREMGASDTGVGLRIKNMAQAFYGRLKAYGSAIGDEAALVEALQRNAYREQPVPGHAIKALAAYVRRNHQALQAQSVEALIQGNIIFAD